MDERSTGDLITSVRRYRKITQAELARRARIPRSVLNTYERGGRQPSAPALLRVLAAADVELVPAPARRLPDPVRAARILEQVLDLAEALPRRRPAASVSAAPFRVVVPG